MSIIKSQSVTIENYTELHLALTPSVVSVPTDSSKKALAAGSISITLTATNSKGQSVAATFNKTNPYVYSWKEGDSITENMSVPITATAYGMTVSEQLIINPIMKGADGTSITISQKSVTYQISENGTTVPTGDWQNTIPTIEKGKFLWTKTYVKYSNGQETTSYSVSYQGNDGKDGDDGRAIVETLIYYYVADAMPAKPTKDDITEDGWTTAYPTNSEQTVYMVYKYIYDKEPFYVYSDVVIANDLAALNSVKTDIWNQLNSLNNQMSFRVTEDALSAVKNEILLTAKNMQLTANNLSMAARQEIIQSVLGEKGMSAIIQLQDRLRMAVEDYEANAGSSLSVSPTEGVVITQKNGDSDLSKYDVNIRGDGLSIRRSGTPISRFRREQLTVSNVRVAPPNAARDTLGAITIKEAFDGGTMFVWENALGEED